MKNNKFKLMIAIIIATISIFYLSGCASMERLGKDLTSDLEGGLDRIVTVYTADGEILKQYEGKIDFESTEGGIVKFDFKGKRYMYYNCYVEAIEK